MSYEINLRFRRFGYGTGHPTGLNMYCIELSLPKARGGSAILRPQDLDNSSLMTRPATSSACTITMDHDAIVCLEPARPKRAPDKDVHVPSVGSTKVPFSWRRCHILVVEYRWGRMWSNESANTIPTTPCATRSDRAPRPSRAPLSRRYGAQYLDPRVPATPPSRWTMPPFFYSRSTDLPVLR